MAMSYKELLENQTPARPKNADRPAVGSHLNQAEQVLELDVQLRGGDRYGFPYAYKTAMAFRRSGELVLYFTTHTVTIRGRNLSSLYHGLLQHRIQTILEHPSDFDDLPEKDTVVRSIVVNEL